MHAMPSGTEPALGSLAESANAKLENAGEDSTNHAFNLGCYAGLMPAALIVLLAFMITKGSWVAAIITATLMILALLGFASLVANVARTNTMDRLFHGEILPEIESTLEGMQLERSLFDQFAFQTLPAGAALCKYLTQPSDRETYIEPEFTQNKERS